MPRCLVFLINDDDNDDDDDEFELNWILLSIAFLSAGTGKKLKQPKRKQNAENKRETKMRPNMIKWEERLSFSTLSKVD